MPSAGDKPLRVAIIRQSYRPDGGAERFVSRAMEALSEQNIELTVIAREWSGTGSFQTLLCNPSYKGRVAREQGFSEAVCALLKEHEFDLVQSHERVPCGDIYRAGDGVHREWLRQRSRVQGALKNWLQSRSGFHRYVLKAERAVFENPELKAVICNSQMVRDEILQNFQIPSERIHVIYNGVDLARFHPDCRSQREVMRRKHGADETTPVMLFVGSGFERKGLASAIRAVAGANKGVHLWVVGKDKHQPRYERLARRLGIQKQVHFLGVQQDVRPFYGAADAFLFPTLYDPFPNVVLEAMACGLPVITSNKCGGAEYVQEGKNGMVADALDIPSLSGAVVVLADQERARVMGDVARSSVMTLDISAMAQQLIQLYRNLLGITS
ncbi:glycosyltransferase family 4 protein [Mangrovitalea sediminis]|uniref:glycosyltransferase family 4 protein n=1 Tax=Mangrovitalea sediminis TaxID=1982043 RepID=UPI000BE5156E|nr:glycosyltransferase family 4 protein [Mangrovitalea sediminis]